MSKTGNVAPQCHPVVHLHTKYPYTVLSWSHSISNKNYPIWSGWTKLQRFSNSKHKLSTATQHQRVPIVSADARWKWHMRMCDSYIVSWDICSDTESNCWELPLPFSHSLFACSLQGCYPTLLTQDWEWLSLTTLNIQIRSFNTSVPWALHPRTHPQPSWLNVNVVFITKLFLDTLIYVCLLPLASTAFLLTGALVFPLRLIWSKYEESNFFSPVPINCSGNIEMIILFSQGSVCRYYTSNGISEPRNAAGISINIRQVTQSMKQHGSCVTSCTVVKPKVLIENDYFCSFNVLVF